MRDVKDATLGSIDGAEGANNPAQNQITASEFFSSHQDEYRQLLAFIDDAPGGSLAGIAGADRAYNLSDIDDDGKLGALPVANTSLDPVRLTAHGIISSRTVGSRTDSMRFLDGAFAVADHGHDDHGHDDDDGHHGHGHGHGHDHHRHGNGDRNWLDDGQSITLSATDPAALIRAVRFTAHAQGGRSDLLLDCDGAVTADTNGASRRGGFATDADVLRLDNVLDHAEVAIDFYARILSIDGIAQTGAAVQSWFAAREAAGGLRTLTLGAKLDGLGWRPADIRIETVPGAPGGGFVDKLF